MCIYVGKILVFFVYLIFQIHALHILLVRMRSTLMTIIFVLNNGMVTFLYTDFEDIITFFLVKVFLIDFIPVCRGPRGRMVKVLDCQSLAPYRCGFNSRYLRTTFMRESYQVSLQVGRWFIIGNQGARLVIKSAQRDIFGLSTTILT